MEAIRQLVLRHFSFGRRTSEPDDELADALYSMLRVVNVDVTVDGWALFRTTLESSDRLAGIGLMTLLPSGSVPVAITVWSHAEGLAWSARFGNQDAAWHAMSDSKRWKSVYLHAGGDLVEPPWTWGSTYEGIYAPQTPNYALERTREG